MHAQPAITLMGRRVIGSWMIAMAITAAAWAQAAPTAAVVPSDAEIRRILVERIDTHRQSVGLVVGVIEPTGRRVVAYGSLGER